MRNAMRIRHVSSVGSTAMTLLISFSILSSAATSNPSDLMISEIKPLREPSTATVWVELINASSNPVSLTGWTLLDQNGIGYSFPEGADVLAPGEFAVVAFGKKLPDIISAESPLLHVSEGATATQFLTSARSCKLISPEQNEVDIVKWHEKYSLEKIVREMRSLAKLQREDEDSVELVAQMEFWGSQIRLGGETALRDSNSTLARISFLKDACIERYDSRDATPGQTNRVPLRIMGGALRPGDDHVFHDRRSVVMDWSSRLLEDYHRNKEHTGVDIQISAESNFDRPLISLSVTNVTQITPFSESTIDDGLYYWRIRTRQGREDVDRLVHNISAWSPARSFRIGESPRRPRPRIQNPGSFRKIPDKGGLVLPPLSTTE